MFSDNSLTIISINYDKIYETMIVVLKLWNIETQTNKFLNEGEDLISSNDDALKKESNFIKHINHTKLDNETKVVFAEKSKKNNISIKYQLLS